MDGKGESLKSRREHRKLVHGLCFERQEKSLCKRSFKQETNGTITLVNALPADQYDFRPDAGGRSLGELAWHLAEIDAYTSFAIERGEFKFDFKPPHIERPKTIDALAPVAHEDALTRIGRLQEGDLHREIRYADGKLWSIRKLLWHKLLMHAIHHRGQLMLLCRLAGGMPPALFGRRREESPAVALHR
jgi:uncharacterized damage-inducible protein DinB